MSTEENKAKVRRIIEEVWNRGNLAVLDELIAPQEVDPLAVEVQIHFFNRGSMCRCRHYFPFDAKSR